jgi:hypothetical protein
MKRGKEGERVVIAHLKADGFRVVDVSQDSRYYIQDIDLYIKNRDNDEVSSIEVKTDRYVKGPSDTFNFCFELHRDYGNGQRYEGWLTRSKADFLFVLGAPASTRYLYIFSFAKLREALKKIDGWKNTIKTSCDFTTTNKLVDSKELFSVLNTGDYYVREIYDGKKFA